MSPRHFSLHLDHCRHNAATEVLLGVLSLPSAHALALAEASVFLGWIRVIGGVKTGAGFKGDFAEPVAFALDDIPPTVAQDHVGLAFDEPLCRSRLARGSSLPRNQRSASSRISVRRMDVPSRCPNFRRRMPMSSHD